MSAALLTSDGWQETVPVGALVVGTTVYWKKTPDQSDSMQVVVDLAAGTKTDTVIPVLSDAETANQDTGELIFENGVTLGSLRDRLLGTAHE